MGWCCLLNNVKFMLWDFVGRTVRVAVKKGFECFVCRCQLPAFVALCLPASVLACF